MTELKPCPFCGKIPKPYARTYLKAGVPNSYSVICDKTCPTGGSWLIDCNTEKELVKRWNTRPSLWTTITDEASLPKESDTGNYCFIHNIHNDVCYRALWQHHWKCWVVEHDINDKYYPIKDIDMWMLNPIPYPTESSKYATE